MNRCATILAVAACALAATVAQADTISLTGEWRLQMSGPAPGKTQDALPDNLAFNDTIELPGTTETRRKGAAHGPSGNGQLTRVWRFEGPAWYQRDVTIPESWRGKRVTLHLERTKYAQVWLDDKPVGACPILCTPHEYALGILELGRHRITIVVDNTRKSVPGDNHQTSDNTQGNWNGILGRIELRATDDVWLDAMQVYPDVRERKIVIRGTLKNASGVPGAGIITLTSGSATRSSTVSWDEDDGGFVYELGLGDNAALWDEFHPNLHELRIELRGDNVRDQRTIRFGLREFKPQGTQFTINGRTTFLRGKHDACVFPLTGHPPMDVNGWRKYFRTCKEWGINHVRFHSWTPPEAAFDAADQVGIYLQTELPFWGDFTDEVNAALRPEALRIIRQYGNHPSFVMMTLGNENRHTRGIMASLVRELRDYDSRRLYAQGSNNFLWDPQYQPGDDFLVSQHVKRAADAPMRTVRGSHNTRDQSDGHVQIGPANTMVDYSAALEGIPGPVIGHEIGQYTTYPNFRGIAKYAGVMRADSLEHFHKRLEAAGMIDQADDFVRASGQLAALCYREELEAALRTPKLAGYQILDLQDFPGQGTALVGMLDAFMDSKGIIEPAQWRQSCAPIVLLARFEKYTWTTDETFRAKIQIAHYGETDLRGARVRWELNSLDRTIAAGELTPVDVPQGGLRTTGNVVVALGGATAPGRLTLALSVDGSDIDTSYPIWVYQSRVATEPEADVKVVRAFDASAREALARGERVVLVADSLRPFARTVGGLWATDFWCWPMFHNKQGTMGILCDPQHPALASFPTESHSNWQWFHIANNAQPLILDDLKFRPIVQVIDNLERAHRLGMIFELKVGPGRLLVCATDLVAMNGRPEAKQLRASPLSYAASEKFNPQIEASHDQLEELCMTTISVTGKVSASSQAGGWPSRRADYALDGNEATYWRASDDSSATEQSLTITLERPIDFRVAEILWTEDKPGYSYVVEVSDGGGSWRVASDQTRNDFDRARHRVTLNDGDGVRALRIRIIGVPRETRAGIAEVRVLDIIAN